MSSSVSGTGGMIRIDSSRAGEYLYTEKPRLHFFQKAGRFLGKAVSFLAYPAAAITALAVPGFGLPLAAGLYGLGQVSGTLTAAAQAKDAATMQAYDQMNAQKMIATPGLFDGMSNADIQTDFITPTEMTQQTTVTVIDRTSAQTNAVENFNY